MTEPTDRGAALVSGAAQGIGLGIAEALAEAGWRVALTDIDEPRVKDSARRLADRGFETIGLPLDVSRYTDWESAVGVIASTWGRLDILANNAGISPRGTIASTSEELWDRTLGINLKGPWLGVKAALPLLTKSRGTIINIGSTRATRPMPGLFPYVTSKAGLWGMTRQMAVELLETGVTCNMVAPGWVDTPGERIIQAAQGRPNFPEGIQNLTLPADVGAAVVYLASTPGRKVNGVTIYLDAGLSVADDAGMVYLPNAPHARYHVPGSERRGAES